MKSFTSLSIKACFALSALAAVAAHAHHGHDEPENLFDGLLHWFSHVDHLAVVVVIGALIVYAIKRRGSLGASNRRERDQP
jgi:hydrogenase/urease accessory protein HupE